MQNSLHNNNSSNRPWTEEQIFKFVKAFLKYRGDWEKISTFVETRSALEIAKYSQIIFEGLTKEEQERFLDCISKEDCDSSSQRMTEVPSESFFAQKIQPLVSGGYQGLFSLVDGFNSFDTSFKKNSGESE